jgi:hypothetical protein
MPPGRTPTLAAPVRRRPRAPADSSDQRDPARREADDEQVQDAPARRRSRVAAHRVLSSWPCCQHVGAAKTAAGAGARLQHERTTPSPPRPSPTWPGQSTRPALGQQPAGAGC